MLLPSTFSEICRVCGQKSIGINFGVATCRACAAFFRRNAFRKLYCETENCQIDFRGKFTCKKCRLQKCHKVGMNVKNFQWDRDVLHTASNFKSVENFLGRPSIILCLEPDKAASRKTIINLNPIISKAQDILRNASRNFPNRLRGNNLEEMSANFAKMRINSSAQIVRKIEKSHTLKIWEDAFLDTATWFTHFEQFRKLPEDVQLTIVKTSWLLWSKLKHLAQTAQYLKNAEIANTHLIVGNDFGIDLQNLDMDINWMTNYSKEQIFNLIPIDINGNFRSIIEWLIDLSPSNIELNYMLCQVSLFIAGKRNGSEIQQITDDLIDVQANHLHDYYQKTFKLANYSLRITKMIKITNLLVKDMMERKERNRIAEVFDVFSFEFSDKEMFEGQ